MPGICGSHAICQADQTAVPSGHCGPSRWSTKLKQHHGGLLERAQGLPEAFRVCSPPRKGRKIAAWHSPPWRCRALLYFMPLGCWQKGVQEEGRRRDCSQTQDLLKVGKTIFCSNLQSLGDIQQNKNKKKYLIKTPECPPETFHRGLKHGLNNCSSSRYVDFNSQDPRGRFLNSPR